MDKFPEVLETDAEFKARVAQVGIVQTSKEYLEFTAHTGRQTQQANDVIKGLLGLVSALANPLHTAYRTQPQFKNPASPSEKRLQEIARAKRVKWSQTVHRGYVRSSMKAGETEEEAAIRLVLSRLYAPEEYQLSEYRFHNFTRQYTATLVVSLDTETDRWTVRAER